MIKVMGIDAERATFAQEPEDEELARLARLIAVALGFHVDTFPNEVKHFTKGDCFRAADAVFRAGYQKKRSAKSRG